MRIATLLGVAFGAFVLEGPAAPAQEKPPPVSEAPAAVAAPAATCGPVCAPKPGFKILWVEREVPIQTLHPREVVNLVPITTFEVVYREDKRSVTEMVLQPREVEKPVTSCTVKPVTVTCPTTGQCSTVMQPCTEVKMVKQIEYVAVPVQKDVIVRVPYLKMVTKEIPQKTIILEYKTELKKVGGPVKVPCGDTLPTQTLLAPKPPCDIAAPAAVGPRER